MASPQQHSQLCSTGYNFLWKHRDRLLGRSEQLGAEGQHCNFLMAAVLEQLHSYTNTAPQTNVGKQQTGNWSLFNTHTHTHTPVKSRSSCEAFHIKYLENSADPESFSATSSASTSTCTHTRPARFQSNYSNSRPVYQPRSHCLTTPRLCLNEFAHSNLFFQLLSTIPPLLSSLWSACIISNRNTDKKQTIWTPKNPISVAHLQNTLSFCSTQVLHIEQEYWFSHFNSIRN